MLLLTKTKGCTYGPSANLLFPVVKNKIYFHTSFNLGLLMMIMKLQELNVLLYEDLKQIKEKLRHMSIFMHLSILDYNMIIWIIIKLIEHNIILYGDLK